MKKFTIFTLSLVVLFATSQIAFGQSMRIESLTKVKDLSCATCNDAVYRVTVASATLPISWEAYRDYGPAGTSFWAKGTSSIPTIDLIGLPKGGIAVHVTDARGQKAIVGFEVVQLVITSTRDVKNLEVIVYPNPALAGQKIFINGTEKVELYSISGKLIKSYDFTSNRGEVTAPDTPGVYVLKSKKFATKLLVR